MSIHNKKTLNPIDVHVGKRVRLRRTILGLNQEQLAKSVGVSFQQIQKYERGINRISASRLYNISMTLNTSISFFFQDIDPSLSQKQEDASENELVLGLAESKELFETDPMQRNETLELVQSYWRISSKQVRKQLLELAKTLSTGAE